MSALKAQAELIAVMEAEMAATRKWYIGWLHVPGFLIGVAVGLIPTILRWIF